MSVRFEQVFVDRHEIEVEERGDSIYVELGFVQVCHSKLFMDQMLEKNSKIDQALKGLVC